jgi:curved DNA-binding protein CbpA
MRATTTTSSACPREADDSQVKKAFRRLARELHPDVNAHDPEAEEKFKEAAEAYEVLSDAERRRQYDTYGHEGLRSGGYAPNFDGFGSISDLFSAFFGGGGGGSAAGRCRAATSPWPSRSISASGARRPGHRRLRRDRPVRDLQGQRRQAGNARSGPARAAAARARCRR